MEIEDLITDIINYIKLLKYDYGLQASFDYSRLGGKHVVPLLPHVLHDNPYCACVKKCHFEKCLLQKKAVLNKQPQGPFFGRCYAGVEEYVFPVKIDGMVESFISVSGYRRKEAKPPRFELFSEGGKPDVQYISKAYDSLNTEVPKLSDISAVVQPLVRMVELFFRLLKNSKAETDGNFFPPAYDMALSFIAENYSNNISLVDIAEHCHCSVSYLSHIFKKYGNLSVTQYLIKMKMTKASELLVSTDASITQIAVSLGYNDSNYFTLQFTKFYGTSPKTYRRLKKQR